MIDSRNPFTLEAMGEVVKIVREAEPLGFKSTNFSNDAQTLTAGYLAAKGVLKIISGGGNEPYVLAVNEDVSVIVEVVDAKF